MTRDLTPAATNAVFGQTDPRVGRFDGGFGASYLASIVRQKKVREVGTCAPRARLRRRSTWDW